MTSSNSLDKYILKQNFLRWYVFFHFLTGAIQLWKMVCTKHGRAFIHFLLKYIYIPSNECTVECLISYLETTDLIDRNFFIWNQFSTVQKLLPWEWSASQLLLNKFQSIFTFLSVLILPLDGGGGPDCNRNRRHNYARGDLYLRLSWHALNYCCIFFISLFFY